MKELPEYICHKRVRAAKIAERRPSKYDEATGEILEYELTLWGPDDTELGRVFVAHEKPWTGGILGSIAGGYYVVYSDGYASYSPAKPFEEGYRLIGEMGTDETDNHGQRVG